jgi:hypothetical protein
MGQKGSNGPIMDQMGSTWVETANYGLKGSKWIKTSQWLTKGGRKGSKWGIVGQKWAKGVEMGHNSQWT